MALQVVGPTGREGCRTHPMQRTGSEPKGFSVAFERKGNLGKYRREAGKLLGVLCTLLLVGVVLATGGLVMLALVTFALAGGT